MRKNALPVNLLPDSFQQTLAGFEPWLLRNGKAFQTIRSYLYAARQFLSLYSDVSHDNLMLYKCYLIDHYKPRTVNLRIFAVNHFLLFLEEECPVSYPALSDFRLHSVKTPRDTFQDSIITNEDCETLQRNLKAEHHDFWYFIVRFLVTTAASPPAFFLWEKMDAP